MTERFKIDRKYVPILATIAVFIILYVYGALQYKGMRQPQAFFNLLINNAFLLITSIGMTFVILTEGIDLSVGSMIALTSVASPLPLPLKSPTLPLPHSSTLQQP